VGHNDWHLPAFRSALQHITQPQSIRFTECIPELPSDQAHRELFKTILVDLDLALGLAGSTVKKVRQHASRLFDGTACQLEIRVELHNGSVISLLIHKFADIPERRMEIFQSDGTIGIDLTKGTSHYCEYQQSDTGFRRSEKVLWPPCTDDTGLQRQDPPVEEAAARQCLTFIHALQKGRHSLSSLEGGFKALEITRQIETSLGFF
jgi:predicted dehydrogenase